jgi:hypothetical protein
VYVNQYAENKCGAAYTIADTKEHFANGRLGSIAVTDLDTIFSTHLLAKLEEGKRLREQYQGIMFDGMLLTDTMHHSVNILAMQFIEIAQQREKATAGMDTQLAQYIEEAENIDRTLHFGSKALDEKTIVEYAERLAKLHRTIDMLETKKKRAAIEQEELQEFAEKLSDIPATWQGMTLEKQRRFVALATEKVTLTKIAPNWLQLAVDWLAEAEGVQDICYIWQRNTGVIWTEEENAILRDLYTSADRETILHALPIRSWTAIQRQAFRLQLSRPYTRNNSGLHKYLSVCDKEVMDELGIVFDKAEATKHAWWSTSCTSQTNESSQLILWASLRNVQVKSIAVNAIKKGSAAHLNNP